MPMHCQIYRSLKISSYIGLILIVLLSCECGTSQGTENPELNKPRSRNQQIEDTRSFLERERESIQAYIKDRDLEMVRSGTGLYFQLLEDSTATESVTPNDVVEFEYDVYLMNGQLLYSSAEKGNRVLKIDREDAVIGLHESLKLLKLGDKGRFILPSHLAYGVAGDQNLVPPMTPLVYEIKVVKIQKSKS